MIANRLKKKHRTLGSETNLKFHKSQIRMRDAYHCDVIDDLELETRTLLFVLLVKLQ